MYLYYMKHLIKKLLREGLLSEISEEAYELLKTKYKDSRVIMSKEEKITFRNNPEQKIHFKPKGLWYGIGASWVDWIRNEQPDWEEDYTHIINVDLSKIKVIRNYQELIEFNDEYGTKEKSSADIDWMKVSKDYSGIEIAPYIYKARYDREVFWYYAWDVASGCIWNSDAIINVTKLNDKPQDYKVVYRGQPEEYESSSPSQSIWVTYDIGWASQYGEPKKYKLPKNLKLLDADYYDKWESLVDEFDEDGDYDEYKYEPTDEFIQFLSEKGYDGFINDDNILVFNKTNVEEIK